MGSNLDWDGAMQLRRRVAKTEQLCQDAGAYWRAAAADLEKLLQQWLQQQPAGTEQPRRTVSPRGPKPATTQRPRSTHGEREPPPPPPPPEQQQQQQQQQQYHYKATATIWLLLSTTTAPY